MHIHILGICGTFMGGIALLAREQGCRVTGADQNVYPPMSTMLEEAGVAIHSGYETDPFTTAPDWVIIGNALSRGNPAVERVLNRGWRYCSGPQWLAEHLLRDQHVLAVAGTHGKTTTTALLMWILTQAGYEPGYLVGGVPNGFSGSAASGAGQYFVVEADEYDTAFFDKRSKFVHYHPRTLIINNLEYDHADIFPDLAAIQRQFHHLVRTVPGEGLILHPSGESAVDEVLAKGCWSRCQSVVSESVSGSAECAMGDWRAQITRADGSEFQVFRGDKLLGTVSWPLIGDHNVHNGLMALAAAVDVGISPMEAMAALAVFPGIKRRMELRAQVAGVSIYDDFAHHPTAMATTLAGLRAKVGDDRVIAVVELGSNTFKAGVHVERLAEALLLADQVYVLRPSDVSWDVDTTIGALGEKAGLYNTVDEIITGLSAASKPGDHVLVMSNKGFDGIHGKLAEQLAVR